MVTRQSLPLRIVEFALCAVLASALVYTVQGAFNVADEVHANVALSLCACILAQGVLFSGEVLPRRKLLARVAFAVLSVLLCVVAAACSSGENPVDDIPQNYLIAAIVFSVVNPLVYALSRRPLGCLALFGSGAFACALIQYLYITNMLVATAVFLLASLALVVVRTHVTTVRPRAGSSRVPGSVLGAAVLLPLGGLALACGLVFGIVMPLDPPHAVIKLLTVEMAYEEEYVRSAVELSEDTDNIVSSSNIDESLDMRTTTDKKLDAGAASVSGSSDTDDYLSKKHSDVDISSAIEGIQALALNPEIPWHFIVLGLLLGLLLLLTVPRYVVHRARSMSFS